MPLPCLGSYCNSAHCFIKFLLRYSPTNDIFSNFVADSQPRHRVGASESDFFTKGVIEISFY